MTFHESRFSFLTKTTDRFVTGVSQSLVIRAAIHRLECECGGATDVGAELREEILKPDNLRVR